MPTNAVMSNGRRLLGSAALVTTAGGIAAIALHDRHWIEWGLLACAGVVAAGGVGLARRSMAAQVLARGTAWTVLAPTALVTAITSLNGHFDWTAAAFAVGSGGALLLARPMLDTAEARAEFAPSSFRKWLFAGATASVATGLVSGLFALDGLRWHAGAAIPVLALSLSLLASAIGVVRMRAWGVLLGALTSVLTLIAALVLHDATGLALALASLPGLMLVLPVLLAQRERARAGDRSFTRVSSSVGVEGAGSPPLRVRVASDSSSTFDDEFDTTGDEQAAAPAPAMRAQA
jgi:hypothetical protein